MSDRSSLRVQLADLDARVAVERQAVSDLRQQLDRYRLIPAPALGSRIHPADAAAAQLRVVLAARRNALSKLVARRDSVAADLERLKCKPAAYAAHR